MSNTIKGVAYGTVITAIAAFLNLEALRASHDQEIHDFADGRGCWQYNIQQWPPHFRFHEFDKQPQPLPVNKQTNRL